MVQAEFSTIKSHYYKTVRQSNCKAFINIISATPRMKRNYWSIALLIYKVNLSPRYLKLSNAGSN